MELKLLLSESEFQDLVSYCKLNNLEQDKIVKKCYKEGFNIERYGLLNNPSNKKEKVIEKEVIKYVEVPKIEEKEIIKIEYVEVEKPIQVIKEVPVEKIVEIIKEIPVEKIVTKEILREVPIEKIIYVNDKEELETKILQKNLEFEEERKKLLNEKNDLLNEIENLKNQEPKVIEKIKEVIVEKEQASPDKSKIDALQQTLMKLRQENLEKDRLIKQFEKTISDIQNINEKKAVYLKGSNLDDKL